MHDRILAGLYGQALGDAWAMPVILTPDDTEQALTLAEGTIRDGGVSVEGAAQAIVDWYERTGCDNIPYVGSSTHRAVQAIKRGDDLNEMGSYGDTINVLLENVSPPIRRDRL